MFSEKVENLSLIERKDYTLSAIFDFGIVLTDYTKGKVAVSLIDSPNLPEFEKRPIFKVLKDKSYEIQTKSDHVKTQVFKLHYGPIASGIWEAGAFEVVSYGERILSVTPKINYKKEDLPSLDLKKALLLMERKCGNFSASYSTAYCMAVEKALGIEVSRLTEKARVVAVELERIYNHVHTIYRLALAASQKVAASHLSALEEDLLRVNFRLFGHRYIFGFNRIGGIAEIKNVERALKDLKVFENEFDNLVDEIVKSKIFIDRLHNTAKLSARDIVNLDSVGVTAKASGVDRDCRKFSEFYGISPVIETDGDSLARTTLRFEEIKQSLEIVKKELSVLEKVKSANKRETGASSKGEAIAFVEAPPGDIIVHARVNGNGKVKIQIRPPSAVNFLAFAEGIKGNVFTDFPFALESFGLSFADASSLYSSTASLTPMNSNASKPSSAFTATATSTSTTSATSASKGI